MRLETLSGTKYYCGRLKYEPVYIGWRDITVSAEVDGEEITLHVNRHDWQSKVVSFELDGSWWYVSDAWLARKVRFKNPVELVFKTVGRGEPVKKRPSAYDKVKHQFAGRADVGDSVAAMSETNDCVVKAVMASMGVAYDKAHEMLKPYRKSRQGVRGTARILEGFGYKRVDGWRDRKLGTFVKDCEFDRGAYVVGVKCHALAVVCGKVIDWQLAPGRKIQYILEWPEAREKNRKNS